MKRTILALLFISIVTYSKAQDYKSAIGVRGGYPAGITFKHFMGGNKAFEGIFSFRYSGFEVTGLIEKHKASAFQVSRLNWYYGAGAHIGFYNGRYYSRFDRYDDFALVGVDGILGIEYNFKEIPFNVSLDLKPAINLVGYYGIWWDSAFSLRYYF